MAETWKKVFTLRLAEEDANKLDRLKELRRETTEARTVKFVIRNYLDLHYENEARKKEITELKFKYAQSNQKVYNFRNSLNALMDKDE